MVTFNKDKIASSFTVTIEGDKTEYIETIKSILFLLGQYQSDILLTQDKLYFLTNLVSCMLPEDEQIISKDDVNLLKQIKKKAHERKDI